MVYALAGLYNFIRQHPHIDLDDEDSKDIYEPGDPSPTAHASWPTLVDKISTSTSVRMNQKRDEIAAAM